MFLATCDKPETSSQRKLVWRGEWWPTEQAGEAGAESSGRRPSSAVAVPAVAVVFVGKDPALYGSEVAALARNEMLGVGPAVYCPAASAWIDGQLYPAVVQEDAGTSLEAAVFEGAAVPGAEDVAKLDTDPGSDDDGGAGEQGGAGNGTARQLAPIGSSARVLENAKILFDVYVQASALHAAGLFHRDIRLANVCVRRWGPNPADIRATLIDHELGTSFRGQHVPAAARRYEDALFRTIPRALGSDAASPTSLERDLGYLAALRFELETGKPVAEALPDALGRGRRPYFSYAEDGHPVVHMLDQADDIDPLARALRLIPVSADSFYDPALLARVKRQVKHGGYVDARDLAHIGSWSENRLGSAVERVAREAVYPRWVEECRKAGREPEYENFDAQPALLQESNRDQARDIPRKLQLLGYRVASSASVPASKRVEAFEPAELEYLAYLEHRRWMDERLRAGWTWGEKRDDKRRTHPDLVPYDELSERSRDLDRSAVAGIIEILDAAGLAVCR